MSLPWTAFCRLLAKKKKGWRVGRRGASRVTWGIQVHMSTTGEKPWPACASSTLTSVLAAQDWGKQVEALEWDGGRSLRRAGKSLGAACSRCRKVGTLAALGREAGRLHALRNAFSLAAFCALDWRRRGWRECCRCSVVSLVCPTHTPPPDCFIARIARKSFPLACFEPRPTSSLEQHTHADNSRKNLHIQVQPPRILRTRQGRDFSSSSPPVGRSDCCCTHRRSPALPRCFKDTGRSRQEQRKRQHNSQRVHVGPQTQDDGRRGAYSNSETQTCLPLAFCSDSSTLWFWNDATRSGPTWRTQSSRTCHRFPRRC